MKKKLYEAIGRPQGKDRILEIWKRALDPTLWRTRSGRGYVLVVRETRVRMYEKINE